MYARHASGGPGRMVGDYEILETLGEGLTSKVKKGRLVRTGRVVALKVLSQESNDRRRDLTHERFREEVQAMYLCNDHRNTVNLLDVLVNAPYPKRNGTIRMANVMVLEFCAHGELFRLLRLNRNTQPLPSYIAREYFHQLMDDLLYYHGRGVSHRDLKSENFLIDSEFGLKIADFGFAAAGRPHMICGSVVGTHAYAAPDVLGNVPMYSGPQADVWSAGVVLFMIVVGHLSMGTADSGDWWFRALHMGRDDLFWESHERQVSFAVAMDAKILITAMLIPEPSRRISMEQIMIHSYLRGAQLPRGSDYGEIRSEMLTRYEMTRAYNHSAVGTTVSPVNSASRTSEGAKGGAAASSAAGVITQRLAGTSRRHNAYPFDKDTYRSTGDDYTIEPPKICAEAAAAVIGGFVAHGQSRAVVKALERVLHDMGAEIAGVQRDGGRTFRTCFKVSAVIPAGSYTGGGTAVGIVANTYRISGAIPMDTGNFDDAGAPDLLVVLRRKREHYFRYGMVEKRVKDRMTTATANTTAIIEEKYNANGKQHDLAHASALARGCSGGRRKRSGRLHFFLPRRSAVKLTHLDKDALTMLANC